MYSVKPNHSNLTLITFYSRTMKTSSSKQLEFVRFLFFLELVLLHFTSYNSSVFCLFITLSDFSTANVCTKVEVKYKMKTFKLKIKIKIVLISCNYRTKYYNFSFELN